MQVLCSAKLMLFGVGTGVAEVIAVRGPKFPLPERDS